MKRLALGLLAVLCLGTLAVARDFRTITGQVYRNATVTRVDPTGIAVSHADGIAFLDFKTLPPEVQREFGFNETSYVATQSANREREALASIQQRATIAAAAAQRVADEQARATATAAMIAAQQQQQAAAASIQQRDYASRDYSSRSYASRDYSANRYVPPEPSASSSGGTVSVRGYYRKDGTYVKGYTRRK